MDGHGRIVSRQALLHGPADPREAPVTSAVFPCKPAISALPASSLFSIWTELPPPKAGGQAEDRQLTGSFTLTMRVTLPEPVPELTLIREGPGSVKPLHGP